MKILVVGATGSLGRLVVEEAIRQGHIVRALVRDPRKASRLPKEAAVIVGDLTRPETLAPAADGVDAIVLTHGSDGAARPNRSGSITAAFATYLPRYEAGPFGSR
jgi:uncharacterized protein YbjT (DUF2867 family)